MKSRYRRGPKNVNKLRHIFTTATTLGLTLLISGCNAALLDPKGIIAADEKELLITAVLLMLVVVIPVIFLTVIISWKYRAGNTKAKYSPEWGHSNLIEAVCWSVPCFIIAILGVITWTSSHQLDPYRPLAVKGKPLIIQVIALNWKWLFIYPDQHIATVNFVQFPENVPVRFLITSDAPMNSFQIPRLAGQIYAMAGMQTKLNIMATAQGDFHGMSTNFSGPGFSNMQFIARVSSQAQFDEWVKAAQKSKGTEKSNGKLTLEAYNNLALPTENVPVEYFSSVANDLYNTVMMKYMMPMSNTNNTPTAKEGN